MCHLRWVFFDICLNSTKLCFITLRWAEIRRKLIPKGTKRLHALTLCQTKQRNKLKTDRRGRMEIIRPGHTSSNTPNVSSQTTKSQTRTVTLHQVLIIQVFCLKDSSSRLTPGRQCDMIFARKENNYGVTPRRNKGY